MSAELTQPEAECKCSPVGHTVSFGEIIEVGGPDPHPECPVHGTQPEAEGGTIAPERIWLQHLSEDYRHNWSWCWHEIGGDGLDETEYVRADLVPRTPQAERDHEVVCLCGSTRFADQHAVRRWEMEKEGAVVLMINYLPAWYADEQGWDRNDHFGEASGLKEHLDELHLRKIDMADRVHVVNPEGYVGNSTAREILYAKKTGKVVTYDTLHLTGPGVAILKGAKDDE